MELPVAIHDDHCVHDHGAEITHELLCTNSNQVPFTKPKLFRLLNKLCISDADTMSPDMPDHLRVVDRILDFSRHRAA
jgi:hypothetical protein